MCHNICFTLCWSCWKTVHAPLWKLPRIRMKLTRSVSLLQSGVLFRYEDAGSGGNVVCISAFWVPCLAVPRKDKDQSQIVFNGWWSSTRFGVILVPLTDTSAHTFKSRSKANIYHSKASEFGSTAEHTSCTDCPDQDDIGFWFISVLSKRSWTSGLQLWCTFVYTETLKTVSEPSLCNVGVVMDLYALV